METKCLICNSKTKILDDGQIKVTYSVCDTCGFIHKDKLYHVDSEVEKYNYSLHNNSFESEGYVKIFRDLVIEHITPLNIKGKVLEYGSGPGPVLKKLLEIEGYKVINYDPYFYNDLDYLNHKYELITSTEVVEHFYDPLSEFKKLSDLLIPGGYLVIMTKLRTMKLDKFTNWWYRRDITHVSFYTIKSLEIIAKKFNLSIIKHNNENIIIFKKN